MNTPCDYCRRTDCHRCVAKLHMQVIEVINQLEQAICRRDSIDEVGINTHLRNVWCARDAINALLSTNPAPEEGDPWTCTSQGEALAKRIQEGTP